MPKTPSLSTLHRSNTISARIRKIDTPEPLIRRYPHDTSFIAWLLRRKTKTASPGAEFFTHSQATSRSPLNAPRTADSSESKNKGYFNQEVKVTDRRAGIAKVVKDTWADNQDPKANQANQADQGNQAKKTKEEIPRMSDPTQNPSQLHGHATYVAGAAKEALGFESGKDDKEYAVQEMRAAKEQAGELGSLFKCFLFGSWGLGKGKGKGKGRGR